MSSVALTQQDDDESPPSPSSNLRGQRDATANVVSPQKRAGATRGNMHNNNQKKMNEYYPNKKFKASTYFKNIGQGVYPLDTLKAPPAVITLKDVAFGMLTLFYINIFASNREARSFPVLKNLGIVKDKFGQYAADEGFIVDTEFISVSSRRESKSHNACIDKLENGQYREAVFVKAFVTNDTESKLAMISKLIMCLRHHGVEAEYDEDTYDQTDFKNQSLDHYIPDLEIIRIIKKRWNGKTDHTFYSTCRPELREAFFSRPYPRIASQLLGYPTEPKQEIDLCNSSSDESDAEELEQVD